MLCYLVKKFNISAENIQFPPSNIVLVMASFKGLTNAFINASQENTVAFANFNFDFSIMKYDAPEAYKGIGELISTKRKQSAEDGSSHITARKLVALFRSAIPDVPNLIRAYGLRATEIASLPTVNPNPTIKQSVFADHIGADATSIWAAATSGVNAVPMHLLACMLARIWKREEAISIWSELVEQRRETLRRGITESQSGFDIGDLTASRVEISRSQLDEWDASAR
jgi:hypothetical protein